MIDLTLKPTVTKSNLIRVLLVEDEFVLALNLQESLETLGYSVVGIADTGELAIQQAIALRPSIILMDIRIRGEIDGVQTTERIWHQLHIPVIYVTGHSDRSTVERALLTSPFGHVLKPIRDNELHVAIQTALGRYERERFLSIVLQSMGDGIIVVDTQLHIKYLNPSAVALSGGNLEAAIDQPVDQFFPVLSDPNQAPYPHPCAIALAPSARFPLDNKGFLVRQDGIQVPIAYSVAQLKDTDQVTTGAVMVFHDDTQRRLAEAYNLAHEQAQLAEQQLIEQQQLNQLKDQFLATTSHELRTPLSNIKLTICLLEILLNQDGILQSKDSFQTQKIHQYLSILREECEQELSLVDDLLCLRTLEAKAYPLKPVSIYLQDWLPHIAEKFQPRFTLQQQTLEIDIAATLPALVSDLPSLTRVINELLNNACKYTPSNESVTISAKLIQKPIQSLQSDSSQTLTSNFQIIVKNTGVEIPVENRDYLFEPFYRIPSHDPWKYSGTGLGLTLAKKLIDYLQGSITVISENNWTMFVVELPLILAIAAESDQ